MVGIPIDASAVVDELCAARSLPHARSSVANAFANDAEIVPGYLVRDLLAALDALEAAAETDQREILEQVPDEDGVRDAVETLL